MAMSIHSRTSGSYGLGCWSFVPATGQWYLNWGPRLNDEAEAEQQPQPQPQPQPQHK